MTREKAIKIVKEFINGTCLHTVDREALETLIPELKESEDEQIRKWIVNLLHELHYNQTAQPMALKAIEWLEKQKEQNPADLPPGFYFIDMNGKKYYSKEFRFGDMKMKVVEKEQKPAEWSEEDEKMRDRIIDILNQTFSVYSALGTSSTRPACPTYKVEIDWLKSLRPQYHGDVTMTEAYKMGLEAGRESGLRDGQKYVLDNADSYGLCKPTMWDKRDDEMWQGVYDSLFLYQGKLKYEGDAECVKMLDEEIYWFKERFKSLRPSWKPSGEQMGALRSIINDPNNAGAEGCQLALRELYKQLKRIKED